MLAFPAKFPQDISMYLPTIPTQKKKQFESIGCHRMTDSLDSKYPLYEIIKYFLKAFIGKLYCIPVSFVCFDFVARYPANYKVLKNQSFLILAFQTHIITVYINEKHQRYQY